MCIYSVKHPSRRRMIGDRMHTTLESAKRAAHRAAKRLQHASVHHWRHGMVLTVFADGTEIVRPQPDHEEDAM